MRNKAIGRPRRMIEEIIWKKDGFRETLYQYTDLIGLDSSRRLIQKCKNWILFKTYSKTGFLNIYIVI